MVRVMKRVNLIAAISLALVISWAEASEVEEGAQLYVLQCEKCHGVMYDEEAGVRKRLDSDWRIHLAALGSLGSDEVQLAVALPNGPQLRGIVGRPAVSVEGYDYSKAMLESMKGMVWTEDALDRWIANSQAWVPGSFMFYKQPDAEIRRKIILYLKANP